MSCLSSLLFSGVWATRVIPKGKRFGPFVGEKKKRSQVTSNVYMWEVCYRLLCWHLSLKHSSPPFHGSHCMAKTSPTTFSIEHSNHSSESYSNIIWSFQVTTAALE